MERHRFTKAEKEYLRGIIHNYSLDGWTDQDIVNWLSENKGIMLDRSTVCRIKNKISKQAEKWYSELRDSRYKYIATHKEAIDALLRYRKRLTEMLDNPHIKYETKVRALSELHHITLSIKNIYKEVPDIGNNPNAESDMAATNPDPKSEEERIF